MGYGGESNAKKVARAYAWMSMFSVHGEDTESISDRRFLVLAGPEAGDIKTLIGFGASPENITAVDVDEGALESSRRIEPRVNYQLGDVLAVVTRRHGKGKKPKRYDVIFLDYCSPISARVVRKSIQVAKVALTNGGMFCTGFMYGREGPDACAGVDRGRQVLQERQVLQAFAAERYLAVPALLRLMERMGYEYEDVIKSLGEGPLTTKEKLAAKRARNLSARVYLLRELMLRESLQSKMAMIHLGHLGYRSGRRNKSGRSTGVPMLYYVCRGYQLIGNPTSSKVRRMIAKEEQKFNEEGTRIIEYFGDDPDGKCLKSLALHIANKWGSQRAAQLLNLKRQQVAAWRAWETMRARKSA